MNGDVCWQNTGGTYYWPRQYGGVTVSRKTWPAPLHVALLARHVVSRPHGTETLLLLLRLALALSPWNYVSHNQVFVFARWLWPLSRRPVWFVSRCTTFYSQPSTRPERGSAAQQYDTIYSQPVWKPQSCWLPTDSIMPKGLVMANRSCMD